MHLKLILLIALLLPASTVSGFEPEKEVELDATEYLPGPAGMPIKVPPKMERQLRKHRALQGRQLGGNDETYYVIGLLETTHRPREATIGDLGRGLAAMLDLAILPVTLLAGEPGILTRDLGPPPPNWVRNDEAVVKKVKGKEAALDLVYDFTTERMLDPPDPQVLHRQRRWFLLTRTRKEAEADAVEAGAIKSVTGKLPNFKNDARFAEGMKRMRGFAPKLDGDMEKLRADIEKLMGEADKLKDDETIKRLRALNESFRAALDKK